MLLQKLQGTGAKAKVVFTVGWYVISLLFIRVSVFRLQELEDQYRKEREEANNLLEQQRLVRFSRLIIQRLWVTVLFTFIIKDRGHPTLVVLLFHLHIQDYMLIYVFYLY